jgi:hypothetical protein
MDLAENYFRGSNDVFYLCEAWKQIFIDDNEVIRIIIDFEKIRWDGKHYPAYTWVALWWKELLNDEREARRLITLAEEHKYTNWDEIAYIWKRLFNNDDEARRCILRQENGAENISARWISCAESWKKILNDDNEARRCLNIAENIAYKEDKPRIQWCVDARKELFGSVNPTSTKEALKVNKITQSEIGKETEIKINNFIGLAISEMLIKNFSRAEYFLNEAIKLGSEEAEKRLVALKYRS